MNRSIENIQHPRLRILEAINSLTIEQLNKVPEGFNNNIVWNLAHMVAAQQGICYRRAGLDMMIDDDFFNAYKPDTKPEKFVDEAGFANIKELMTATLKQFDTDYDAGIFGNYGAFTTRYGVELRNIDDAIGFIPFHEGLHIGYIMSLRKLV